MKKTALIISVIALLTAFVMLFLRNVKEPKKAEIEVFMFDTLCSVTAYGDEAEEAVARVFDRLAEIHKMTDYFSDDSQVTKINNADAGEAVEISEDMAKILAVATEVSQKSDGSFDVTVASVMELWNFSGEGIVPSEEEIKVALSRVGLDMIEYDGKLAVTKKHKDVRIDLGGAAKGFAGDEAIEILKSYGVDGAIVDLGGNITCTGKNPQTSNGKWRIGIQEPFSQTGSYSQIVEVEEGAVVTSGIYQRYFEKDGRKYHHIIDPKTGYPAEKEYSSVTVVAESGLYADCLATACYVMPKGDAETLAKEFGAELHFK